MSCTAGERNWLLGSSLRSQPGGGRPLGISPIPEEFEGLKSYAIRRYICLSSFSSYIVIAQSF